MVAPSILGVIAKPVAASAYTGPLDLVTTWLGWWGVRAASVANLGQNIFRLKRVPGDQQMDFAADAATGDAPTAAITAWLAGSDGFYITLYDQSGNGKNLTFNGDVPYAIGQNGKPKIDTTNGGFVSGADLTFPNGQVYFAAVMKSGLYFHAEGDGTEWVDLQPGQDAVPEQTPQQDFVYMSDAEEPLNECGAEFALAANGVATASLASEFGNSTAFNNGVSLAEIDNYDSGGSLAPFTTTSIEVIGKGFESEAYEFGIRDAIPSGALQAAVSVNQTAYYDL